MDADTFSDKEVIEYANSNFYSYKINAELNNGRELSNNFNIRGFPTILFLNEYAKEIDRIIGYLNAEAFLLELKRIKSGKNTLPFLKSANKNNPNQFGILYKLAKKYQNMNDIELSKTIINQIINENIDSLKCAEYMSILFEARETKNPNILIEFSNNNPTISNSFMAIQEAIYLVKREGSNKQLEADLYIKLINFKSDINPEILNNFSWRMSELELYLDTALKKVILAIENSNDNESKYMYIDTKAEVLWKMGRIDEAIKEIGLCRKFKPNDKYYKDQEEKFKKSI